MQQQGPNSNKRSQWDGHRDEIKDALEEKSAAIMDSQKEQISPLVSELVGQCHALLRQELEKEARRHASARVNAETRKRMEKALARLGAVEGDIEAVVLERTRDKLFQIVRDEIQKVFQDVLADAEELLDFRQDELPEAPDQMETLGAPSGEGVKASSARRRLTHGHVPPVAEDAPVPPGDETAPFGSGGASTEVSEVEVPKEPGVDEGVETDRPSSQVTTVAREDDLEESIEEAPELEESLWQDMVDLVIRPPIVLAQGVRFQQRIRQSNDMRLLQVVGTRERGMTVRVRLEKPVPLFRMLQGMAEVAEVRPVKVVPGESGGIPRLYLTLRSGQSPEEA